MRLQKYLADCGIASRRTAERYIAQGRVKVNGHVTQQMGVRITPGVDEVVFDGQKIEPEDRKITLLFNKPYGVITTMRDPEGRRCVGDYFLNYSYRLYPVGRLDYDTEGALLMTNDGALAKMLTHPSHEIPKHYHAAVFGMVDAQVLRKLRQGVLLDGRVTAPAQAEIIGRTSKDTILHIAIHEGRNRQVRRMIEAVGYDVHHLKREAIGGLKLGDLQPGTWHELSQEEIATLFRDA